MLYSCFTHALLLHSRAGLTAEAAQRDRQQLYSCFTPALRMLYSYLLMLYSCFTAAGPTAEAAQPHRQQLCAA